MVPFPELSAEARRVLRAISDNSIMRGSELMKWTGVRKPDELLNPLLELHKYNLIEGAGDVVSDPHKLPFTSFGIRPSNSEYVRLLLRSQLA